MNRYYKFKDIYDFINNNAQKHSLNYSWRNTFCDRMCDLALQIMSAWQKS